ncbi:ATP-dependent helicase [Salidesulfovibrio brasiliensis]|uniref:ATP-dependent helicase n=1 Tax=Salidesulfovibrio brasiliensis TaxID=221711 RepID=UPI0006D04E67|nr:ATP-dependent helicase [Salidesulfovibrio brasiliensis]
MSIDLKNELNKAQYEAVTTTEGPVLVIAGAGSGKTRTIVYRLAHLVEQGVDPAQILLLTFTRKASQEMLTRAAEILGRPLDGTSGGTFHSFAFATLRRNAMDLGFESGFTLMDRADQENAVRDVRAELELGKGDKSFPKKNTVLDLITKSRNKEEPMDAVVQREAYHLSPYVEDLEAIARAYAIFKKKHALLDYDDLLFELDKLLTKNEPLRNQLSTRYRYIMVDEYQDTNLVQARIVKHLVGESGNVMAVGDDAQSIYAFRGANVDNILKFPEIFSGTKIVRLERNYRSVQQILDLTNHILDNARTKFDKELYSDIPGNSVPEVVYPISDQTQAKLVLDRILKLSKKYPLNEIAVLFRAGYQSFHLETSLARLGVEYRKFGGIRFNEAAHVKDVMSLLRLCVNTNDLIAWQRALDHVKGVGPKTVAKIYEALHTDSGGKYLTKMRKKHEALNDLLNELDVIRKSPLTPAGTLDRLISFYQPILTEKFPDDYPKRQQGLDQLAQIATSYQDMDQMLADLSLEGDPDDKEVDEESVVLSTVHSAKGLEWKAVILIDLVEDRFPSRRAVQRPEDLEEERRLMYVACTRAKEHLSLFVPKTIYNRYNGSSEPAMPSPFVMELPNDCFERFHESYSGGIEQRKSASVHAKSPSRAAASAEPKQPSGKPATKLGYCNHKIFGKGKIIAEIGPDKYRINFPGFGLKVIIKDYVELL